MVTLIRDGAITAAFVRQAQIERRYAVQRAVRAFDYFRPSHPRIRSRVVRGLLLESLQSGECIGNGGLS